MTTEVYELADREEFARRAGELVLTAGLAAEAARGRFLLVLTGGRTVQPLYRFLATDAEAEGRRLLSRQTFYFWGDERWVAPDHPDSNQGLARRLLLDPLSVPEDHLLPLATSFPDPVGGASANEQRLREFFAGELSAEGLPVFDLVLLGLGPDGHVASLFPGAATLTEPYRWVRQVPPPELLPRLTRLTLTLPLLNRARLVVVLAAGGERVKLARRIIAAERGAAQLPASRLAPAGRLVWLLTAGG